MTKTDKLYDTLGELLYIVALADGAIQPQEIAAFQKLFENHPWKKDIEWSFSYEVAKKTDIETLYKKVIDTCHANGPAPEYEEFISAMKVIANAVDGIETSEDAIIKNFSSDLVCRFQKDLNLLSEKK